MNRVFLGLLLVVITLCSGCRAFRDAFDQPDYERTRPKSSSNTYRSPTAIFPFSQPASMPKSSFDSSLSDKERSMLSDYRRENNIDPTHNIGDSDRANRKWVFGY